MGILDRLGRRTKQKDEKIEKRCSYHIKYPAKAICTKCNQPICNQCCNGRYSDYKGGDVVCVACRKLDACMKKFELPTDTLNVKRHLNHMLTGGLLRYSNPDESIFHFETAIRLARQTNAPPDEIGRCMHGLGTTYGSRDEWQKSLELHKKAAALAPDYNEGRVSLATAFLDLRHMKEARSQVKELKRRGYQSKSLSALIDVLEE